MSEIDVIEPDEDLIEQIGQSTSTPSFSRDPIIIRGTGKITLFGLNSRFNSDFPSSLGGKLAPEEFLDTMSRINGVLRRTMPDNIRWLFCGCILCCCTFGCSLWPVICLRKRTMHTLEKTLDWENCHLYNRLGMHWRLARTKLEAGNMAEYVLHYSHTTQLPVDRSGVD